MKTAIPDRRDMVVAFRKRLLEAMSRAGLSRSGLARSIGIDRSTLSQLMAPANDRLPRADTVAAIAGTLQVSVDWLLGLAAEERRGADIMQESVEVAPTTGSMPLDENLARWRAEAVGYKIRHVPTTLPDVLKSDDVLRYEYRDYVAKSSDRAIAMTASNLAYSRMQDTDVEICCSAQMFQGFAGAEGIWRDLPEAVRRQQLAHMAGLLHELYPRLRLFLFDARARYAVPYSVFGPNRAAIFLGQMYFVFNTREHVRTLGEHFDGLIRAATVQPHEAAAFAEHLHGRA